MIPHKPTASRSVPALVSIICAARGSGDRLLERGARRELREQFGIEITFRRQRRPVQAGSQA